MSAETTETFYLATPQSIVWNYFEGLRRRVAAVLAAGGDDNDTKQDVVICIMLAVLSVEIFLNVYFRVVVTEEPFDKHEGRNALMHFTSSHETISFVEDGQNIVVQGLADMAAFAPLTRADAAAALGVAENTVREIMRLRGVPEHAIRGNFHLWTGQVPLAEWQKAATIRFSTTIPPVTRIPSKA